MVGPSSRIGEKVTLDVFLEDEEFELWVEVVDMTLFFFLGWFNGKSDWLNEPDEDSIDTTHVLGFVSFEIFSGPELPMFDEIDCLESEDTDAELSILLNLLWWKDSVGV